MEEYKKDDRGRSKAKRLTGGDPHEKVDSSSWTPSAPENAGVKTGARPLTKRLYKKGGKVVGKCEGGEAMKRADRKPRKAGGRTNHLTPDSLINRDVRTANEVREGTKHDGAFKKGGRTKKFSGGMLGNNPVSDQDMMMGKAAGMRKHGGKAEHRKHREDGGSSFKNTKTGKEITPAEVQFGDKNGNIPTPPRRQYKSTDDLVQNAPKTYNSTDDLVNSMPRKRGGHVDVAEDKALIKKMVKPEARTGRKHGGNVFSGDSKSKVPGVTGGRKAHAGGGRSQADIDFQNAMLDPNTRVLFGDEAARAMDMERGNVPMPPRHAAPAARPAPVVQSGPSTRGRGPAPAARPAPVVQSGPMGPSIAARSAPQASGPMDPSIMARSMEPHDSGSYSPEWSTPSQRALGHAVENIGSFYGNTDPGMIYAKGGRAEHAKGGRTKGKTQVNIIIGAGGHQPQQQSMPNAPVPAPQMHMPSTPQGGAPMPPQGMPPQGMPPQGMPMPRKSGGRTSYPIETGSGGGEARLDKIKAYGLTPPKRK